MYMYECIPFILPKAKCHKAFEKLIYRVKPKNTHALPFELESRQWLHFKCTILLVLKTV